MVIPRRTVWLVQWEDLKNQAEYSRAKKLPGNMGNKKRTVQNLQVYKVDASRDIVYVKGHVPGKKGGMVRIKDAKKNPRTDL
mmetsp:Transcript_6256/g.7608  ORF Transcript_6256/g.7608 Transcript_6256/m.7608 type:complete len:82 (-) Transcript_6256:121-366(-)